MLSSLSLGLPTYATIEPADTISFTITTTTNYFMTSTGSVEVKFDSIQLTQLPPQAYAFGVNVKTSPGSWITRILWQFGDGSSKDVPYCCQSQISEVQYHAYPQPGSYVVTAAAFDNTGNWGFAVVTVNWATSLPEYPDLTLPMIGSILVVLFGLTTFRSKMGRRLL